MDPQAPVRVAVLSPFALVRAGLDLLVGSDVQRAVVVDCAGSDGHLGGVEVAVYDLAGLAAPDTRADLRRLVEVVPVIGLVRDGRPDLAEVARALGVRFLVPEDVTSEDLVCAVETAAGRRPAPRGGTATGVLTERERTVLTLVADGMSNHEIADELFLSINSVKTYIRTSYRKIGVDTRSHAVLWAVRHGLATNKPRAAGPGERGGALVERSPRLRETGGPAHAGAE